MRVRIGKSIKAKSLFGQCNIPYSYTGANVVFYPLINGTFMDYTLSPTNIYYINRKANHKYFIFLNCETLYSSALFGIWDTKSTGYEGNRAVPIKDKNNYYTLISPTTAASNGVPTFQFWDTQNLPSIAYYAVILDLTEIGLDNLTAQQFYNKYKNKLELLATGWEIVLDDKSGQANYTKSKSSIGCKIADTYYGYNQLENPLNTSTTNAGIVGTFNASDLSRSYLGTSTGAAWIQVGYSHSVKKGHKYLFLTNINLNSPLYYYLLAFGAGKEPSTVEEFKAKFTKDYYGYCPTAIKLTQRQIEELPYYMYHQMVQNGSFENGATGWTPYNVTNISVSVTNGELSSTFLTQLTSSQTGRYGWGFRCYTTKPVLNHKYLLLITFKTPFSGTYTFDFNNTSQGKRFSITQEETNQWVTKGVVCTAFQDVSATNCIFYPYAQSETIPAGTVIKCKYFMIIDLTDWYGEGNEPTTVEEFRTTFPNLYYPYSKKRLLNRYMINKLIN